MRNEEILSPRNRAALRPSDDGMAAGDRFHYRRLDVAELPRLNRLYNLYYKRNRPLGEVLWLYTQNPLGAAVIYAAFDEHGRLAGIRPCIPFKLWWNGEERRAYEFADALVHPCYQRRGIFSRLLTMACEHAAQEGRVLFSLPNERSLAAYRHIPALRTLGDSRTIARPLSWMLYLGGRLRPWRDAGLAVDTPAPAEVRDGDFAIVTVERFEDDLADVHRALRSRGLNYSLRTREFLQWRYFGSPVRRYHVALLKEGRHAHGYVVIRMVAGIAHLVDVFLRPQTAIDRRGFALIARWGREMGAIGIHFSAAGNPLFHEAAMASAFWFSKHTRRLVINQPGGATLTDRPVTLADVYFVMGDFDFL